MRNLLRTGALRVAACLTAWCVPAMGQEVLWQTPIYAEVASALDFGGQVLSRSDDGRTRLIVGAAWEGLLDGVEIRRARVIAYDTANGTRLWQRDLVGDCADDWFDIAPRLATFANGDVVVAARKQFGAVRRAACYARLDARDGRILWSVIDRDPAGAEPTLTGAITVDTRGDVLATGRRGDVARTIKLSGADGSLLWQNENAQPDWSLYGRAVNAGSSDLVLVLTDAFNNGTESHVDAIDSATGALRWQSPLCGLPRAQPDGSVVFASACSRGKVTIGRLAGDGRVLWQREIEAAERYWEFDENGDVVLVGTMHVDGVAAEVARFSAADGRTRWAAPGALGHLPSETGVRSVSLFPVMSDGRLIVWEMIGTSGQQKMETGRLSLYDTANGRLLRRKEFTAADRDRLYYSNSFLTSLPDGEALLGSLNNYRQLWLGRIDDSLNVAWGVREPVASPQQIDFYSTGDSLSTWLLAVGGGAPGVIVGGRAITEYDSPYVSHGFPHLAKLTRDGSVLWRWQPKSLVESASPKLDGMAADASGALYAIGYAADAHFDASPFVARIDSKDGRSLWERFGDRLPADEDGERARSLALAGDEGVVVASTLAVRRYAAVDGALLWTAPLSRTPGAESYADVRIAIDAVGDVVVTMSYSVSGLNGEEGVDFFKLRGVDGVPMWHRRVPVDDASYSDMRMALLPRGDVVVQAREELMRVSGTDGEIRWRRPGVSAENTLVDRDGGLLLLGVPAEDNRWHAIARVDASNGATLWSVRMPVDDAHYDDGGRRDSAAAFDSDGGLLFAHRDGAGYVLAKLAVADGTISWRETIAMDDPSPLAGLVRDRNGRLFMAVSTEVQYSSTATVLAITPPGGETPTLSPDRHSVRPLPPPRSLLLRPQR